MSRRSSTELKRGLDAPICLTWELTYACNLECVHCLSSSGRRDPASSPPTRPSASSTSCAGLQVFYVNIGGGEPMIRRDFFEIVDYSRRPAASASSSRPTARSSTPTRRAGWPRPTTSTSRSASTAPTPPPTTPCAATARTPPPAGRWITSPTPGSGRSRSRSSSPATTSTSSTTFKPLADSYGAQLRVTRLRPSGRGADTWHDLHPTNDQQRQIYRWLLAHGDNVLTGDSFFHLNALGEPLPGLNLCGAGRVVCLIDPVGDVYACPFVIHDEFKAGNVRDDGGFDADLARERAVPAAARAAVGRRLRVVRPVRRLPGRLHGRQVLHRPAARRARPRVRRRRRRAGAGRRRRRLGAAADGRPLQAARGRRPSRSSRR